MEVRVWSLHLLLNRTGWRLRAQGGHGGVGGWHRGRLRLRVGQRWRGHRRGWTDRRYRQGVTLVVMGCRLLSVRWSQPVIHDTVTFMLQINFRTINLRTKQIHSLNLPETRKEHKPKKTSLYIVTVVWLSKLISCRLLISNFSSFENIPLITQHFYIAYREQLLTSKKITKNAHNFFIL